MERAAAKGDVPVLVMAVLTEKACHGYAIAREIERRSGQALTIKEGTLYPALRVLEQQGLIVSEWAIPESGPARKVYSLTTKGQKELEKRTRSWRDYQRVFNQVLEDGTQLSRPSRGGNDVQPA